MIARVAAVASLAGAVILVVLLLLGNGPDYTLRAEFQDSGGLVTGDDVMIGPAKVGSVQSIGLSPNGLAEVKFSVDTPMHDGTVVRIYENSLSGIANRYVVLEPGPADAPEIHDGATIARNDTYSFVSLDQLFNTLTPQTRTGLRDFIQGEAASIAGRAPQANKTLEYFAPALASTSDVTRELARNEPQFDSLLVHGAQTLQTLGSRTTQLTELVANTNATTAAIASQSQNLEQALRQLGADAHPLDRDVRRPAVDARRAAAPGGQGRSRTRATSPSSSSSWGSSRVASIPTVSSLNDLIRNPTGNGDLITLLQATPALANIAESAFPRMIKEFNDSQPQVDYFREYTPDVVAALSDLGQTGGYYDANGHYARTQPFFGAFGVDGANQLTDRPPSQRFEGLQVASSRCPGAAVQPAPDGSSPWLVPGCSNLSVPPGP